MDYNKQKHLPIAEEVVKRANERTITSFRKIKLIGSGSGRTVYRIKRTNVAIKLAKNVFGLAQNKTEYKIFKAVCSNTNFGKIYEPIYNKNNDVIALIVEFYPKTVEDENFITMFRVQILCQHIASHCGYTLYDIHDLSQYRRTKDNRIVLVDYGYQKERTKSMCSRIRKSNGGIFTLKNNRGDTHRKKQITSGM